MHDIKLEIQELRTQIKPYKEGYYLKFQFIKKFLQNNHYNLIQLSGEVISQFTVKYLRLKKLQKKRRSKVTGGKQAINQVIN